MVRRSHLGVVVPILFLGCSGPGLYPVSGDVSWQGEQIPDGDIIFYPEDGKTLPDVGRIVNGRYETKARPGRKIVQIFATKEKPVPKGVMNQKEREPIIPTKYNAESRLAVEIRPEENRHDFRLPE
jgi:hypothetical protein